MTNVRKNSAKLTREDLKIAPESPTMKLSENPAVEPSDQTSKTGPQGCSSTGVAPGLEKCKGDMPMTNVRKNSAKLTREDLKIAPESPTMKLSETPAVEPSDQTSKTVRHAPLVYRVEEIAQLLAISNRAAYNLCNTTKDFKVIRLGTSIRVSKQSFDDWFAAV